MSREDDLFLRWYGNSLFTPLLKEQSLMLMICELFLHPGPLKTVFFIAPFLVSLTSLYLTPFLFNSFFPYLLFPFFPSPNFSLLLFFNHPHPIQFQYSPVFWTTSPSPSLNPYHFPSTVLFSTLKMETAQASEIFELIYVQASHLKDHNFLQYHDNIIAPYCV